MRMLAVCLKPMMAVASITHTNTKTAQQPDQVILITESNQRPIPTPITEFGLITITEVVELGSFVFHSNRGQTTIVIGMSTSTAC